MTHVVLYKYVNCTFDKTTGTGNTNYVKYYSL